MNAYRTILVDADRAARNGETEAALYACISAAHKAWLTMPGKWRDADLERIVKRLGRQILGQPDLEGEHHLDVLFIMSSVQELGGHTELALNWMRALYVLGRHIQFVSTEIPPSAAPERLAQIGEMVLGIEQFGNELTERIERLGNILRDTHPRLIILCIHPHDAVTVATLGAFVNLPPVLFLNHADHCFWLGANLPMTVIEYRAQGEKDTREQRGIERTARVPLICEAPWNDSNVNLRLQVPSLSLTIATEYKIEGSAWDYLRAIEALLWANPTHRHILILAGDAEKFRVRINRELIPRFMVIDAMPHEALGDYYRIATFLIESWPYNGATVRYEAMSAGVPVLAIVSDSRPQDFELMGLPEGNPIARNEAELVAWGTRLIHEYEYRKFLQIKTLKFHIDNLSRASVEKRIAAVVNESLAQL